MLGVETWTKGFKLVHESVLSGIRYRVADIHLSDSPSCLQTDSVLYERGEMWWNGEHKKVRHRENILK